MEYAIEVDKVKKEFKIHLEKTNLLKDAVVFRNRNRVEHREILKGISFKIPKGEAVGLIGRNGCGKSTTLKLLTRILTPNEGMIKVKGRVSSLIELGAGFHPDMSGRENIYINASIFGITKKEVDKRLDDIVRFSELEEFIDNPVRTYSSGMYMRLAFSVAINVDADILLIDEILAVGDTAFQQKCFERLHQLKKRGTTIVIVSHSLDQVIKMCDRAIWIEEGVIKEDGQPKDICKHYLDFMDESGRIRAQNEYKQRLLANQEISDEEKAQTRKNLSCRDICCQCSPRAVREGDGAYKFTAIKLQNLPEKELLEIPMDNSISLYIEINQKLAQGFRVVVETYGDGNVLCFGHGIVSMEKTSISIKYEGNRLLPGRYWLSVYIQNDNGVRTDELNHIIDFVITDKCSSESVESYGIFNIGCSVE